VSRRTIAGLALAAGVVAAAVAYLRPRPPERIILVVVDTLRRDHVSAYAPSAATPNIDVLAKGGTVFTNAVASFHQTTMAMAALLTGLTPSIEGTPPGTVVPWNSKTWCGLHRFARGEEEPLCVPESVPTLAAALRAAGYRTVGVVGNPLVLRPSGFEQGFDDWLELRYFFTFSEMDISGGKARPRDEHARLRTGLEVNRLVQKWLAARTTDRFFLYVHYTDVHDYQLRTVPYATGVARADWWFGELHKMLEAQGLLDDAVIILTSDHGEGLDEMHALPGGLAHLGNPSFESVLQVPLLVWPAVPDDPRALVRSDDVARLIRRLARIDAGPAADLEPGELFVGEQRFRIYRRGNWKSIRPRPDGPLRLFDLGNDPGEQHDVAGAHADEVAAHQARVDELSRRLATPAPPAEPSAQDAERLRALGYAAPDAH
jgi:arylsulfatase A-like enzyme